MNFENLELGLSDKYTFAIDEVVPDIVDWYPDFPNEPKVVKTDPWTC